MMENALEINGLYKHYDGFALQDVSFMLPRGVVMGFIGETARVRPPRSKRCST